MYNKTTGPHFIKYGSTVYHRNQVDESHFNYIEQDITSRVIIELYLCHDEIIIDCIEGVGMLVVSETADAVSDEFIIHRLCRLNANLYYNVISMTEKCKIRIYYPIKSHIERYPIKNKFETIHIQSTFNIQEIYSYYYNVKGPGYIFDGEAHDYFELIYVDNGILTNDIDQHVFEVHEYELIILGPNQFHKQAVINQKPCSYLSIMFHLELANYPTLLNKVFKVNRGMLDTINKFVDASDSKGSYREDRMISYLKILIIELLEEDRHKDFIKPTSPINQKFENEMINEILTYIDNHIFDSLFLEDICEHFSISRSSLQNLFKDNLNIAPKQYINKVKLNKSQILIKESKHTISEIASILGFNSIHYFSRKFTQHFKITPSDYAKSIYKDGKTLK